MALSFAVLASGSAGNASLLWDGEAGLLIDIGIGPRVLAHRLRALGLTWSVVRAVLLTHTHADHWTASNLAHLKRQRIPLYCHAEHHAALANAASFQALDKLGLLHGYDADGEFTPVLGLNCRAVRLRHDSGATFGFRFQPVSGQSGQSCSIGYAADLGCWDATLVEALADTDLLALEFNHDVAMQLDSGRHPQLIDRVLGDEGHLSNTQAAELLRAVLARSDPGRLRHVIQLHLSQQCNTLELARAAAQAVVDGSVVIHTACQERVLNPVRLG